MELRGKGSGIWLLVRGWGNRGGVGKGVYVSRALHKKKKGEEKGKKRERERDVRVQDPRDRAHVHAHSQLEWKCVCGIRRVIDTGHPIGG